MKQIAFPLLLIAVMAVSCWEQQWEERLASGDTGCVTHGGCPPPGEPRFVCGTCTELAREKEKFSLSPEGMRIFKSNCASCHLLNSKKSTGPGFYGITERIPGRQWAYALILQPDSLLSSGDPYYSALYSEYGHMKHPAFPQLTKIQINAVLGFSNQVSWYEAITQSKEAIAPPAGHEDDGKFLYQAYCANCHTIGRQLSFGPSFVGVRDRIPGGDWQYLFIQDEKSLVNKHDAYTLRLNKESTETFDHSFSMLTRDEIDAILMYSDAAFHEKLNY